MLKMTVKMTTGSYILIGNLNSQNPAVRDAQTQRAYVKVVKVRTPHMQVHLGSIQIIFLIKQAKLHVYVFETPCLQTAQVSAICRSPASNSPRNHAVHRFKKTEMVKLLMCRAMWGR